MWGNDFARSVVDHMGPVKEAGTAMPSISYPFCADSLARYLRAAQ